MIWSVCLIRKCFALTINLILNDNKKIDSYEAIGKVLKQPFPPLPKGEFCFSLCEREIEMDFVDLVLVGFLHIIFV